MPVNVAVAPTQITPSLVIVPDVSDTVIPGVGNALMVKFVLADGRHAAFEGVGVKMA